MSRKANYFTVGLFILVGIFLLCSVAIIFGAGSMFERHVMIETYFTQSVQGLDVGSPAKFRGVKIGEVSEISLVSDAYDFKFNEDDFFNYGQYVLVRVALEPNLFQAYSETELHQLFDRMVERGLRFQLSYLGITGLAYLEADYLDPDENPKIDVKWKPEYYHIPAVPNIIARLDVTLNALMKTVDQDLLPMMQNLNEASEGLPEMIENMNEAALGLPRLSVQFENALRQVTPTLKNLKELTASAKKYPSQFVFSEAPPKSRFDRT